jgi:hypothetical protein
MVVVVKRVVAREADGRLVCCRIVHASKAERVEAETALAAAQPGRAEGMRCLVALVRRGLLVRPEDRPPVDASEEALDDAKGHEATDVDPERVDLMLLLPLVDRQARPKTGVEAAQRRPLDRIAVGW